MPDVAVDVALFTLQEGELSLLLVQRGRPPFEGMWALPGGFVEEGETLESAMRRELEEETGLHEVYLEQLHTFGDPGRDPRGWIISVAYLGLTHPQANVLRAGDDAAHTAWFPVDRVPALAFDHAQIVALARQRLRERVQTSPIGFYLLPCRFTLNELQSVYEAILGGRLDRRNFRRKMLRSGLLRETGQFQSGEGRPAKLYELRSGAEGIAPLRF